MDVTVILAIVSAVLFAVASFLGWRYAGALAKGEEAKALLGSVLDALKDKMVTIEEWNDIKAKWDALLEKLENPDEPTDSAS